MTNLFIEPGDVWLFRDGRPFSAGSDHRAQSAFPPFPTVVAGMVRTGYLLAYNRNKGVDFTAYAKDEADTAVYTAIGSPNDDHDDTRYGSLKLGGPYVALRQDDAVTRYYPAPADLFAVVEDEDVKKYLLPTPLLVGANLEARRSQGASFSHLLWIAERNSSKQKVEAAEGWLDATAMSRYLSGDVTSIKAENKDMRESENPPRSGEVVKSKRLFGSEDRLGIALQSGTKSTQEGMLYTVGFTRPHWGNGWNVGINLEVEGIAWPATDSGIISIGGERRAGLYRKVEPLAATAKVSKGKQLKIYFATPAYFEQGWYPRNWGDFFVDNPKVEIVAAAINSPLAVGGFDLARNRHKPVRRYVPAGSVYYLKSGNDGELVYNGKPITDADGAIGFGQVLIGEWR